MAASQALQGVLPLEARWLNRPRRHHHVTGGDGVVTEFTVVTKHPVATVDRMSDDDVRILPASPRCGLWLHSEDPTAILGDPWGGPAGPGEPRPGARPHADKGLLAQALLRLHHAVMARPQA